MVKANKTKTQSKKKKKRMTKLNPGSSDESYEYESTVESDDIPISKTIANLISKAKLYGPFKVTTVLNKDSPLELYSKWTTINKGDTYQDHFTEEDHKKFNQNKSSKVFDVDEQFKSKFKTTEDFLNWFNEDKFNMVKDIFIQQKLEIENQLRKYKVKIKHHFSSNEYESKCNEYLDSDFNKYQKLNRQENLKSSKNYKEQINLYKNRITYNINHGIKSRVTIDEETKWKIITSYNNDMSIQSISKELKVKYQSVWTIIRRFFMKTDNRQFSKHIIFRKQLTEGQVREVELFIDKEFKNGDNSFTIIKQVKEKFGVDINRQQAYSLIKQFGNKQVKIESVQYDHHTKDYTLSRHLFSLYQIAMLIHNKIEIFTSDEFGLQQDRKSNQLYKKPLLKKFLKSNSKYSSKLNVVLGCSMNQGIINLQISEKAYNSFSFREFLNKFIDEISDNNLDANRVVNILVDDASFHGWTPTMKDVENHRGNIGLTHLSGMLSMSNVCEYFINNLRHQQNKLPNKSRKDALKSLHQVVAGFDKEQGLKCYHSCSHTWLRLLTDIQSNLKSRIVLKNDE